MNYRCRDYKCTASLKLMSKLDLALNIKVLKLHVEGCREIRKERFARNDNIQTEYIQFIDLEI